MVNNAEQSDCLKEPSGATILNPAIASADSGMNYEMISIAAKQREGITELQKLLVKAAALPEVTQNDVVVSNVRHYEALSHALEAIHRVQEGMSIGLSGDLVSQDLRECLFHLAEIVGGEITNDEVLGNIFKNFCIGK